MNILQMARPWSWPPGYDVVPFNPAEHALARHHAALDGLRLRP